MQHKNKKHIESVVDAYRQSLSCVCYFEFAAFTYIRNNTCLCTAEFIIQSQKVLGNDLIGHPRALDVHIQWKH